MTAGARPRVTYLITSSSVAGAQRQVHDLALAMLERGWEVSLVSMMPRDAAFADLPALGVPYETLGMTQGVPDPRALWRLRGILRLWRPNVLHGHMIHANLLGRLSRLLVRTPVVISTMHSEDEGAQWRYYAYRATDRLGDLTTTVSQMAVERAISRHAVSRRRIRLVPNGLPSAERGTDAERRKATRSSLGITDEFLWLAAGRIDEAKDYPNMIAAFAYVHQDDPQARLLIAGTGALESQVHEAIDQANLGGRVTMLGLRSDVPRLMEAADGFVLSSAWEGLPMVLLEAGASALPAVTTDVAGGRDAVIDGVSGLVVPPRDPAALGTAMLRIMGMAVEERQAMGAAGRGHVASTFDMVVVADSWNEIYRDLLARRSGRQ